MKRRLYCSEISLLPFVKSDKPSFGISYDRIGFPNRFLTLGYDFFNAKAQLVIHGYLGWLQSFPHAARKHFGKRPPTGVASAEV